MAKELSETARLAKEAMEKRPVVKKQLTNADFLSFGVPTLNLACANRVYGGIEKGSIVRLIGKTQTCKTVLAGGLLAEAANSPYFDGYELYHNDIERGRRMEIAKFWGKRAAARVKPMGTDKTGRPIYSSDLIGWYKSLHARFDKGEKFVEITDSLDALVANDAETKMTDGKAKIHSQEMRKIIDRLDTNGSIIVLIQHAKINLGNTWAELVTTGGASPGLFSSLDLWLSKRGPLKKTYNSCEYNVGNWYEAHIIKNRFSGQDRKVTFPLYPAYGIDELEACIWFLCDCNHWKKAKKNDGLPVSPTNDSSEDEYLAAARAGLQTDAEAKEERKSRAGLFNFEEFNFVGKQSELVLRIDKDPEAKKQLRELTGKVWREILAAISPVREPRYL